MRMAWRSAEEAFRRSLPDGYAENDEDCDDEDLLINPDAADL